MRVEQNNFRDMFSVYLSGPPQTQHVFGIFPAALVAHTGLAGEERLKAFPLQIFGDGNGGNVRIPFTAGEVCRSSQKYWVHGVSVLHVSADGHGVSGLHDQNDLLIA